MIFHSGAKLRRFKYTVRPQSTIIVHGPQGPVTSQVKPLRAIFKYGNEHTFDSIEAQSEFDWTDDERKMVEDALQNPKNGYFGRSDDRRIYRGDTPQEVPVVDEADVIMCKATLVIDGEPRPCPNSAIAGGIYCDTHVLESVSSVTIALCDMPDTDGEGNFFACGNPVVEGSKFCANHTKEEVSA